MQKKLIAVAVAGALGAPAVALAQTSTVQVYGKATFEYGYADQGNSNVTVGGVPNVGRPNTDIFQTPGGSAVGFRGEEKLGGGLSAWFQCESSADVRGLNQDGFCSRNSAAGLKGAFGNIHVGRWDTPFKRASYVGLPGGMGRTGLLGGVFLMAGNSTSTGAFGGQGASQSLSRNIWYRRESAQIYYESPTFSGFNVLASYTPANATGVLNTTTNAKPRVQSIAGFYTNGPLALSLGYERHNNFGNGIGTAATCTTAAGCGSDDRAWTISGAYTFAGVFKLAASYIDQKYEMGATTVSPGGTDLKKKNWIIGAEWNVSGPHSITGFYGRAGDSKGNSTLAGITGANGPIAASGPDTGARQWEIAYKYAFSKRTWVTFGYVRVDNDSAATYTLGGLKGTLVAPGNDQHAWAMYWDHTF